MNKNTYYTYYFVGGIFMNCVIPYTKEILFKTKIAEISSISLEHEMSINDTELLGNFIVSGEYKAHELSVNKDDFSYTLPFSIDLSENIDLDSIDFSITDFSYEVVGDNTLKVFIEFSVVASEKVFEKEEEQEEIWEDVKTAMENDIELPEVMEETLNTRKEDESVITEEERVEDRIDNESQETIIDSINNDTDTYALYHIHMVKEAETIDMISAKYNTTNDLISEYNDLTNVTVGDKLIIPEESDE